MLRAALALRAWCARSNAFGGLTCSRWSSGRWGDDSGSGGRSRWLEGCCAWSGGRVGPGFGRRRILVLLYLSEQDHERDCQIEYRWLVPKKNTRSVSAGSGRSHSESRPEGGGSAAEHFRVRILMAWSAPSKSDCVSVLPSRHVTSYSRAYTVWVCSPPAV